jgi:glucose-6-phosphate isomerase
MRMNTNNLNLEKAKSVLETHWKSLTRTDPPGFIQTLMSDSQWTESESWAQQLKEKFSNIVVLGIGGSSMGGRALVNYKFSENIYFLDNIDPSEVQQVWSVVQPKLNQTAFLLISKSGDSLEVMSLVEVLNNLSQKTNFNFFKN